MKKIALRIGLVACLAFVGAAEAAEVRLNAGDSFLVQEPGTRVSCASGQASEVVESNSCVCEQTHFSSDWGLRSPKFRLIRSTAMMDGSVKQAVLRQNMLQYDCNKLLTESPLCR